MFNIYLSHFQLLDVFASILPYIIFGILLYFVTAQFVFSLYKFYKKYIKQ